MSKAPFLPHIEFLRAVAIVLVVYTHVSWPLDSPLDLGFYTLFQNGTVVFLFIAGFLFSFLNPTLDYRAYLGKKLRFVVAPYLILSAFFIALQIAAFGGYGDALRDPLDLLGMLVQGAPVQAQFWFIPMVVLFYLCAPLFARYGKTRWGAWSLVLTLPLSALTWRPYGQLNPLLSFVHFFGVYHFGVVAGARREAFDRWAGRKATAAAALAVFLASWAAECLTYASTDEAVFEDLFRGTWAGPDWSVVQKLSLLILVYHLALRWAKERYPATKILGEYSFGIFFLHLFFISAVQMFWPGDWDSAACAAAGLAALGASVLTVFLAHLALGKRSRWILGS